MWQFVAECAKPGYPGGYAKVTHVLGWIHNYLNGSDASCGLPVDKNLFDDTEPGLHTSEITSSAPKGTTTTTREVEISVTTKRPQVQESFSTEVTSTSSHSGGAPLKSFNRVFASFCVISVVTLL